MLEYLKSLKTDPNALLIATIIVLGIGMLLLSSCADIECRYGRCTIPF